MAARRPFPVVPTLIIAVPLLLAGAGVAFAQALNQVAIAPPHTPDGLMAPASATTLKALTAHYAALGHYTLLWKTTDDVAIDPSLYNRLGNIAASTDYADALQRGLRLTVAMGVTANPPALVGCFDLPSRTVEVIDSDSPDAAHCRTTPFEVAL